MHAVHAPTPGRMGRQASVVIGFFDEVLGPSTLVIEPHQPIHGLLQVGHKHPVAVLWAVKQLVLLAFGLALLLLLVAQRNKAVRLAPTRGLIPELALLVGIGLGRSFPSSVLQ